VSKVLDWVIGSIVAVYFGFHKVFSRGRCSHLHVVREGKFLCKYCGEPMVRTAPGTDGRDR
jgi:hypothetical protein